MKNMLALSTLVAVADTFETTTTTTDVDPAAATGILAVFAGLGIIWIIFCIAMFGYWLWMLIDSIKTTDEEYAKANSGSKIMWILLILILGIIPAIIYHFMVKKKIKAGSAPAAQ